MYELLYYYHDLDENYTNLGYQEWENGRLKSIILLNNDIYQIPDSFGKNIFLFWRYYFFQFLVSYRGKSQSTSSSAAIF